MRAVALHDWIVAPIEKMAARLTLSTIPGFPGVVETLKTAARLRIPTVIERLNANTRFAMEVVQKECDRLV